MERKLINYLPYAIRDFAEFQGITTGEQPEFKLAWDAREEVFANQFVGTALDYGLSRWEKMLNITPKGSDTLESRRARIKAKLNNFVPYTIRAFARMMTAIANGEPFEIAIEPGSYLLSVATRWTTSGQHEGLEYLIKHIVPCNIAIISVREAPLVRPPLFAAPAMGSTLSSTELPWLEPPARPAAVYASAALWGGIAVRKLPEARPAFSGSRTFYLAPALGGGYSVTRLPVLPQSSKLGAASASGGSFSTAALRSAQQGRLDHDGL